MWFNEDEEEEGKVVVVLVEKFKLEDDFLDNYEKFMEIKKVKESEDKENFFKRIFFGGFKFIFFYFVSVVNGINSKFVVVQILLVIFNGFFFKIINLVMLVIVIKGSLVGLVDYLDDEEEDEEEEIFFRKRFCFGL